MAGYVLLLQDHWGFLLHQHVCQHCIPSADQLGPLFKDHQASPQIQDPQHEMEFVYLHGRVGLHNSAHATLYCVEHLELKRLKMLPLQEARFNSRFNEPGRSDFYFHTLIAFPSILRQDCCQALQNLPGEKKGADQESEDQSHFEDFYRSCDLHYVFHAVSHCPNPVRSVTDEHNLQLPIGAYPACSQRTGAVSLCPQQLP